jgi:hypothetical protein
MGAMPVDAPGMAQPPHPRLSIVCLLDSNPAV